MIYRAFKWYILSLILGSGPMALAQEDCNQKLIKAEGLYEQGQFSDVISVANNCLESTEGSGDQMEVRWKAYRLLALAYLATNENEKAKDAAIQMLEINPRYKPSNVKDPNELVKLLQSITIIPKLSLGLAMSVGYNNTFPSVRDAYFLADGKKTYTGLASYQFGGSTSYQFKKELAIGLSVMWSSKKYEISYPTGDWDLRAEEKLTYINFPLYITYIPDLKYRIRPYAQLGGYAGALFLTDNSFYATYRNAESYSLEHIQSKDRRNKMDYGVLGGIGAYYNIGEGHLSLQASYFHSMNNVTNEDSRYNYNDLQYKYFYLDDNFTLNNLYLSLGYSTYLGYKVIREK